MAVTVRPGEDETLIEVSDNGSGIPELERSVIGAGLETPLEHSQGLGLWLTYWCVTMSDGTLDLDTGIVGTTVTLEFPQGDTTASATA